jgi:hypothetical protein
VPVPGRVNSSADGTPTVYRPRLETRVANVLPGLLVAALCLNALAEHEPLPAPLWSLGVALGLVLMVRGYRMAVIVGSEWIRVRGLCWSRAVPTASFVTLTGGGLAKLRWKSSVGQVRWTPVLAFSNALASLPRYTEHNRKTIRAVRAEVDHRR